MEHVVSYWFGQSPKMQAALPENASADVVVIGGGLAGLGACIHLSLARPDLDLMLLEGKHVGFGASGRNAGIVEAPLLIPAWLIEGALPRDETEWALACLHRRIEGLMDQFVAGAEIAEVEKKQIFFNASNRVAFQALRQAHARSRSAGLMTKLVQRQQMEEKYGARSRGAIQFDGYALNPMGLSQSIYQTLASRGIRGYENTRVLHIVPAGEERVEIHTENRTKVVAKKVVVCTGAWTRELACIHPPRSMLAATYMLASTRLDDRVVDRLGGAGCCISEIPSGSYRRIHQGRLLFGGLGRFGKIIEPEEKMNQKMVKKLQAVLAKSLPWLSKVEYARSWAGTIQLDKSAVPRILQDPKHPQIIYNLNFHGIMLALLSGAMIQGLVLGKSYLDDEAERLRRAYLSTKVPVFGLLKAGLGWLYRSFLPAKT